MKIWTKSILLGCLIAQILFLTACGNTAQKEVAMGRYIEKAVELAAFEESPQPYVVQRSDGKLELFTYEKEGFECYEQQEDLSFKSIPVEWLEAYGKINEELGYFPTAMTVDENDCVYMIGVGAEEGYADLEEYDPTHQRTYILKVEGEQLIRTVLNIGSELPYIMPSQIEILDNGHFMVGGEYTGVKEFDQATGNLVRTYAEDEYGKFCISDNKVYLVSQQNQGIDVYSLESGQLENHISCDSVDEATCIMKGTEGFYLINKEGIWHQVEGGEVWEQMMTSQGVSIGLPSRHLQGAYFSNGEFIAYLFDSESRPSLKAYIYSETTPTKPEVELSAYMLKESQSFREALVSYELAHPEVRVNVQVGMSEENGLTKEDAIKALNTSLLAGSGPDLLLLDSLEMDTYMDKDLLAPLDEIAGIEQIVPQIKNAFTKEDGLFIVPLRFRVPCFFGTKELVGEITSIDELMAYQKAHMNEPVLSIVNEQELSDKIVRLCSNKWMSKDGVLNKEAVTTFLEGVVDLSSFYDEYDWDDRGDTTLDEALAIISKRIDFELWNVDNIWELLYISDAMTQREGLDLQIINQDGKACFEPRVLVGINQSSKQISVAKEIVSYMLSEEVQAVDTSDGFPVVQDTLKKWLAGEVINQDMLFSYGGEEVIVSAQWEHHDMVPVFEKMLEALEVPVLGQEIIEDMVLEEAEAYFNEEKNLEDIISSLESKVALYNEG